MHGKRQVLCRGRPKQVAGLGTLLVHIGWTRGFGLGLPHKKASLGGLLKT
jgi:hypothetical protein